MLGLVKLVNGIKITQGRLLSPEGIEYRGFEVHIGGISDPGEIKRSYEDIERILHQNQVPYKIIETKTDGGTFKSYSVSTS